MKLKLHNTIINFFLLQFLLSVQFIYAEQIDWVRTFGGIKNEHIDHILVCPNNDIIVIGTFSDSLFFKHGSITSDTLICDNEYEDVFIAKFHSHGSFMWATSLAHGPENYDWWLFPSVDQEGNLFLSGTFIGEITIGKDEENEIIFSSPEINSSDIFLTRILADGQTDWAHKLGDEQQEQIWDLTSDNKGFVYLTGLFSRNSILLPGGGNDDIILTGKENSSHIYMVKYNNNGDICWANKIINEYSNICYAIAVSRSGKVSIAGEFSYSITLNSDSNSDTLTSNGLTDIFIATYDSNGVFLWATSDGGSAYDMAYDLEYDSQENVIVTGHIQSTVIMGHQDTLYCDTTYSWEYDDVLLAKYDSEGNYLWAVSEGGSLTDRGERVQIFKNDKILLSGWYWNEATFSKGKKNSKTISNIADTSSHFAAKYTPDGILYWVADVDSSFSTFNTNMAVDSSENVIRAGEYYGDINLYSEENSVAVSSNGGFDIYLAKFITSSTSVHEEYISIPDFLLNQNYPNPFNPKTVISYSLPATDHIDLSIYNILGQKVATLVNKKQSAGAYNIEWNASTVASGVYIYKLKAGAFEQSRKMILLR